jgi:hypothetical protein
VELELAGGRGAVDPFAQRHERDPEPLEIIEQRHEVAKIAPETVETPANDASNRRRLASFRSAIEGGTAFLRAAHPLINVFPRDCPSACVRVSA